jgi:hypothetical protein
MPNVSTYIRTEDLGKYLEIAKDKGAWTEFIHNALNPSFQVLNKSISEAKLAKSTDHKPPKKEGLPKINIINTPTPKFCKHGNPKGLCMDKQASRLKCNV